MAVETYHVPYPIRFRLQQMGFDPLLLKNNMTYDMVFEWFDKHGVYVRIEPHLVEDQFKGYLMVVYQTNMDVLNFLDSIIDCDDATPEEYFYKTRIEALESAVKQCIEVYQEKYN